VRKFYLLSAVESYIGFIIIVRELIKGKNIILNNAYKESSQYFWKIIGYFILVTVPITVPLFLLGVVHKSGVSTAI